MGRPGSATTLHYSGSPRTLGCLRAYTFHHNGSPRTVFSGGQAGGRRAGGRAGKLTVARAVARAVWRWRAGARAVGRALGAGNRAAAGRPQGGRALDDQSRGDSPRRRVRARNSNILFWAPGRPRPQAPTVSCPYYGSEDFDVSHCGFYSTTRFARRKPHVVSTREMPPFGPMDHDKRCSLRLCSPFPALILGGAEISSPAGHDTDMTLNSS